MSDEAGVPAAGLPFGFDNPEVANAVRAGILAVLETELAKAAPRWCEVVSIDHDAGKCVVDFGDEGTREANMHAIRPSAAGQIVLIEGSGDDRRVADVQGGFAHLPGAGETGDVKWTRSSAAGFGWLYADGSTVIPDAYADLQALVGGSVCPNLRDRVALGSGNLYTLGTTYGAATVTLAQANLPSYNLTVTEPNSGTGHRHFDGDDTGGNTVPDAVANGLVAAHQEPGAGTAGSKRTSFATTGITVSSAGSGTAFSIIPPAYALKPYIHV